MYNIYLNGQLYMVNIKYLNIPRVLMTLRLKKVNVEKIEIIKVKR